MKDYLLVSEAKTVELSVQGFIYGKQEGHAAVEHLWYKSFPVCIPKGQRTKADVSAVTPVIKKLQQ